MNFSRFSSDTMLGRVLRVPLRLIPRNAVMRILQGPMRGKKWIAGSSDHGCWLGSYEATKQQALAASIHEGCVVWDVGAHVGYYSLLAATLVGENGRVFAFEPFPDNVRQLREHLRINQVSNVVVIEAAVSDQDAALKFKIGETTTTGLVSDDGELEVKAVRLDALLQEGRISPPDVIKLDVEGAELTALQGAANTLREHQPVVFLATHGNDVKNACRDFLTSAGYSLKSISGAPFELEDEFVAHPLATSKPPTV